MAWDYVFDPLEVGDKPGGLTESFKAGLQSTAAGLAAIPAAAGSDDALRAMRENQRIAGNAQERSAAAGIPQTIGDIHGPTDVLKFVAGQAAGAAPVIGGAALGTAIAGPVGGFAAVAPQMIGNNLSEQYAHNQTFNPTSAVALGLPQAALAMAAPEARLFQRGASAAEGALIDTGSRTANAAIRGGATALSQSANMGATAALGEVNTASVDPNYDLFGDKSLSNIGEAAAGGFVAGGLIGMGHGIMHGPEAKPGELPTDKPNPVTSPDALPNDQFDLLNAKQSELDLQGGRDQRGYGIYQPGDHLPASDKEREAMAATQGPLPAEDTARPELTPQMDLFRKQDEALPPTSSVIDVPGQPPAPNPDARIVLPNEPPAPNPDARIEPATPAPTPQDQLLQAQRAQSQGQLLDQNQTALLRQPPEPVNPNAQLEVPPEKPGFQLTPDRRSFDPTPAPQLELQHSEAPDPRQMELPLDKPEASAPLPVPDEKTGDLFEGTPQSKTPWQTRARMAWMDQSDGSLQGFHKAMAKVLSAKTPEEAAEIIRAKADDSKSGTAFAKLDAIHKSLTGDSLEEHATREAAKPVEGVVAEKAQPAEPVVGGESDAVAPEAHAQAAPVAGEIKPEPAAKPAKPSNADKSAEVKQLVESLDTIKKDSDYQKVADRLHEIAETSNGKAHDDAVAALYDAHNGFTPKHIETAENNYTNKKLDEIVKASDAGVKVAKHTAEAAPEAKAGLREGERTSGDQVVNHLAANATDPAVRQAMRAVGKNVDLSKVTIERVGADSDLHPAIAHALSDGADGAIARFPDGRMTIHMAPDAGEEAVAHELIHAATLAALDDPVKAKPFVDLMNEVKAKLAGSAHADAALFDKHALGDVKEFVAYAATNQRFRALLDSIDRQGKLSAWDRFKQAVGKVLSIPKVFMDKLLGKGKSDFVSGSKLRFDSELNRMLENGAPEAQREAAEIKLHTFSTSPEKMVEGVKEGAQTLWDTIKAGASKTMLGAMPTHVIVDQFKHVLRSLPDVMHSIEDRTVRQHQLAREGVAVHDALKAAFKDQKSLDRLHRVFENAQLAGIDPRTEPMDRVQAYLRTAKEKLDTLPKTATPLERARAEDHLKKAAAGAALKADWNAMGDAEKHAFTTAVNKLKSSMETRQKVANDILLRAADNFHDPVLDKMRAEGASEEAINQQIIDTYGKAFKTVDGAYAPMKRFGDWVVSRSSPEMHQAEQALREARATAAGERQANGKLSEATNTKLRDAEELVQRLTADGRHREVTFHESSADAQRAFDASKDQYKGHDIKRFTRGEYNQHVTAANGATIGKILEAVGKELPPELKENVTSLIRDMYVDALPDGSFQQTQQARAGVAGYSTDFSRAILDSLMRDSFQISTLEHSEKIGDAMRALDTERRNIGTDNANNIYRTLSARIDASTNFKQFAKWEQSVSHAAHIMYLGASPAFLLMNAAQVPMITLPMLHARFGMVPKVEAHMSKAVADVWKAIKKGRLEVGDHAGFTAEEKQVLTRLQDLGILNMTQMHDTAQAARSSNIIDPKTAGEGLSKGTDAALNLVNMPAQYVETVNRAASALAAYRLAREGSKFGTMDHGAAMDYAAKVVRDSHVDYSAQNNPAWMKNGFMPGSRLLFQFKKYWLNMLSMVSSNMYDAFGHHSDIKSLRNALADSSLSDDTRASKQELLNQLLERKGVARRTLAGLYGMHMLTTGALGVPFAGSGILLANIMRHWYSDPEDHADTETDLRNYLAHALGATGGNVVMDGVFSGLFGMGISQRIGMGDLASPSRLPKSSLTGANWGKEFLVNMLGPTVGMGLNWMDAAHNFEQGDYERGTEKLLPKMIADPIKGWRRAQQGGEASGDGKMVAKTDERDAIYTALGITPSSVQLGYKAKAAVDDAKASFDGERNLLIKRMAQAALHGEGDDQSSAREEIAAFNERNPGMGLKITASDLLKAQQRLKTTPKPKPKTGAAKAKEEYFDQEGDFAKEEE
jgi:hypothetical protein